MKGFWSKLAIKAADGIFGAVKRDIEDSRYTGRMPLTVWVLGGALVGSLVGGFFWVVIGGIAGAVLRDAVKERDAVEIIS
jgi:hypothetical protein